MQPSQKTPICPFSMNNQSHSLNTTNKRDHLQQIVIFGESPHLLKIIDQNFILEQHQHPAVVIPSTLDVRVKFTKSTPNQPIKFIIKDKDSHLYEFYALDSSSQFKIKQFLQKNAYFQNVDKDFERIKICQQSHKTKVIIAYRREDKKTFAIKCFVRQRLLEMKNGIRSLLNEINLLKSLNYPNLVKLQRVYASKNTVYVVMEHIEGCNLWQYLFYHQNQSIPAASIKSFMRSMLHVLSHLSANRIIHRDIKPQNIMLRKSMLSEPVLIDFGLGQFCDNQEYVRYECGTPGYIPPQSFQVGHLEPVSDMFSLGVVFYILFARTKLFEGADRKQTLEKNKKFRKELVKRPVGMGETEWSLLLRMIEEGKGRIEADQALAHGYFSQCK